jgi:malonyl-CoA/methylmalonyl-CoA synthetase
MTHPPESSSRGRWIDDPTLAWKAHLGSEGPDPAAFSRPTDTLIGSWSARARSEGGRPFLYDAAGAAISTGQVDEETAKVAAGLAERGAPGQPVALFASTTVAFVVAYLGVLRAGMVAMPCNPRLTTAEVDFLMGDARPAVALAVGAGDRERFAARSGGPEVVGLGAISRSTGALPRHDVGPQDPALLCYTSGTTSTPKGVVLTHGNLCAGAQALCAAWRWRSDDVLVLALPLFHVHGLGVGLHGTLLSGGAAHLLPRFSAEGVVDAVRVPRATMFFGVPTMYADLARAPGFSSLGRLRLCVSGSAPLPVSLFEQIEAGCGQRVVERYGMTETIMLTSNPFEGPRRQGTVGLPLPGVTLALRALVGAAEGPAGTGEIVAWGPNVFSGYLRRPDASAAAFDTDGGFRTGDVGAIDDAGYLRIVGRAKELIISGGENVSPAEVEEVLRRHPGLADAAVVGLPSDRWGEEVVAFVEADEGLEADLADLALRHLAPHKRPKRYVFVRQLPRTALGKVMKASLREPS